MEWISVKDRLPDKNIECLVYPEPNNELYIISAEFQPWDNRWKYCEYDGYGWTDLFCKVTHWIPLPGPPE